MTLVCSNVTSMLNYFIEHTNDNCMRSVNYFSCAIVLS